MTRPEGRRRGSGSGRNRGPASADDAQRRTRQREMDRQLQVWTPRRLIGWIVAGISILMLLTHLVAHIGWRPVPLSMGWQDLLIGYPDAGVLGVVAAIVLGQDHRHTGTER